jgi:hypothetical protein
VKWILLPLVGLLILVAACGTAGPAGSATGDTGIEGTVVIGPTCPVESVEHPCPDRPLAADVVVSTSGGKEVATVHSGSDGKFRIGLRPGGYVLTVANPQGDPVAKPVSVTVPPRGFVEVTVSVDSGIR